MSFVAFILIAASVLLHALWHFISKSSNPKLEFFLPVSMTALFFYILFPLCSGISLAGLPFAVWGCAFLGGLFGVVCDIGLSFAYRFANISQAYPMARALPVLMTAAVTVTFGWGKTLSHGVLAGMAVIFLGCMLLPLKNLRDFRVNAYCNKGMFGILLAAVGTTGYTIADGAGIHAMLAAVPAAGRIAGAGTYGAMREIMLFSVMVSVLLIRSGRRPFRREIFTNGRSYLAGIGAAAAYILVLIAMGYVSNVSYVQAFRQLSLPIGVLLGVWYLKERVTRNQLVSIFLILGGLIVVYLA